MPFFNVKNITIATIALACGAGWAISQNQKMMCSINPNCYDFAEIKCSNDDIPVCTDKNGKLITGKINKYYNDGNIAMIISLKDGKNDGEISMYHKNGQVAKTITYKDGIANGEYVEYYPSGALKLKGNRVNGNTIGESKWYYENGKLMGEINIEAIEKNGNISLITGLEKEYYEDGTLKMEKNLLKGEGDVKIYHSNGLIASQGEYHNGQQNGIFKDYYDDGKLRSEYTMIDGKVNGISTHYYEDGQSVFMILSVKDGENHGEAKAYSRNGKLQEIAEYENGIYVHHTFIAKDKSERIFTK